MPRRRQREDGPASDSSGLDDLYAEPLESFTASRNQLARTLRKAGDEAAAERVSALRKPTVPAWAVNQLSRRHRREVDLLLDAGHRLIETQQAGGPGEISAAARQHRDAVEGLVRLARSLLASRASEDTVRKVAETLRAASLTEEGREELARGRLTDVVTTTGWDILLERSGGAAGQAGRAATKPKPPDRKAETARARSRLKEVEAIHGEALRVARDAAAALEEARHVLDAAELRANAAAEALAGAAEAVSEAKAELDRLRRATS